MPQPTEQSTSLERYRRPALLITVIGFALAAVGAWLDLEQFWRSYLLAYLFWLQIGLGCLAMVMLHHLAGGQWSALIRRIMETGAMTLLPLAALFLPLLLGLSVLYPWADAEHAQHSLLLQQKTAYLNVPFFVARAVLYFTVWVTLSLFLRRWSLAQDQTGDPALAVRMRRLSAAGMILYMLTATFAAYDWMMSLEPEWFSSIYGLLVISGQALAALAVAIIGLRLIAGRTQADYDWTRAFNHLGNLTLAFVMLWAYLAFSQFLIIWSANLPEEAVWYVRRSQGGWLTLGMGLIAFHFAVPFFLLLSRRVKRSAHFLTILAVWLLAARWLDLAWLLLPALHPDGLHLHWLDLATFLALGGGWVWAFAWLWTSAAPLPRHDPRLPPIHDAGAPVTQPSH